MLEVLRDEESIASVYRISKNRRKICITPADVFSCRWRTCLSIRDMIKRKTRTARKALDLGEGEQKNQLLLVDAFEKVKREFPDTKLVLIGVVYDREYFKEIQKKILEKDLDDTVILLANIEFDDSTLFDAYSACDLFVLPRSPFVLCPCYDGRIWRL